MICFTCEAIVEKVKCVPEGSIGQANKDPFSTTLSYDLIETE